MKILAFLQNLWLEHPERWESRLSGPEREMWLKKLLFFRCKTGVRLRKAFKDQCENIVWEETSRNIGSYSAAVFPADLNHMLEVVDRHDPDVILLFGSIASGTESALGKIVGQNKIISGPHPAARYPDVEERLAKMNDSLQEKVRHFTVILKMEQRILNLRSVTNPSPYCP